MTRHAELDEYEKRAAAQVENYSAKLIGLMRDPVCRGEVR